MPTNHLISIYIVCHFLFCHYSVCHFFVICCCCCFFFFCFFFVFFLIFWVYASSLIEKMDTLNFIDGRVHFRHSGVKGLTAFILVLKLKTKSIFSVLMCLRTAGWVANAALYNASLGLLCSGITVQILKGNCVKIALLPSEKWSIPKKGSKYFPFLRRDSRNKGMKHS